MNVSIKADPQFSGSCSQGHESIPGMQAFLGARAETDIPFADPLADASSFDHNMALRARFAAIRWVRAGRFASRGQVPCLHPGWPATNPIAQRLPVFPTVSGAADPKHLLLASLAIAASRSSRCHISSRPGASPRGCLSSGQTKSRSKPLDWKPVACNLSVI